MGVIQTSRADFMAEAMHRAQEAQGVARQLRKPLLAVRDFPVQMRRQYALTLVFTKLLYNVGTWSGAEHRAVARIGV
eukprot:11515698-Alexandrium_andersonii.AAC.1